MAAARSWISVPQLVQDDTPGRHLVQQLMEKYSGLITSGRSFIAGDCPSEVRGVIHEIKQTTPHIFI
jgi:hypothetical protein